MAIYGELIIDDEDELARLKQLRRDDPDLNLAERYQYFVTKDPILTEKQFGFVRRIVKHGFTVIGIRQLGLAYTVGLWYSHAFPELMLVAGESGAAMERMNGVLQDTVDLLWEDAPADPAEWRPNPRKFLEPRAQEVAQLAFASLRKHGLRTDAFHNAEPDFLKRYPFGYGWHFYQKFADESDVPILRAVLL